MKIYTKKNEDFKSIPLANTIQNLQFVTLYLWH
jgi:hypothetical protein